MKPSYHGNNENSPCRLQIDAEDGCGGRNGTKRKTSEERREMNRQRSRDIRKRKKIMNNEMQKQLLLLTTENSKLRAENDIQKQEITLLKQSAQALISNNRPLIQTTSPPTRLSNSDIINIINGIGNTHDYSSGSLLVPAQLGNIRWNDSSLHSSVLPTSTIDLLHEALQHRTNPFSN